jgi:hypothetical protein
VYGERIPTQNLHFILGTMKSPSTDFHRHPPAALAG